MRKPEGRCSALSAPATRSGASVATSTATAAVVGPPLVVGPPVTPPAPITPPAPRHPGRQARRHGLAARELHVDPLYNAARRCTVRVRATDTGTPVSGVKNVRVTLLPARGRIRTITARRIAAGRYRGAIQQGRSRRGWFTVTARDRAGNRPPQPAIRRARVDADRCAAARACRIMNPSHTGRESPGGRSGCAGTSPRARRPSSLAPSGGIVHQRVSKRVGATALSRIAALLGTLMKAPADHRPRQV